MSSYNQHNLIEGPLESELVFHPWSSPFLSQLKHNNSHILSLHVQPANSSPFPSAPNSLSVPIPSAAHFSLIMNCLHFILHSHIATTQLEQGVNYKCGGNCHSIFLTCRVRKDRDSSCWPNCDLPVLRISRRFQTPDKEAFSRLFVLLIPSDAVRSHLVIIVSKKQCLLHTNRRRPHRGFGVRFHILWSRHCRMRLPRFILGR